MSSRPTKENVRNWTRARAEDWPKAHKPLPSEKQLRRELGIDLQDAAKNRRKK